MKFYEPDEPERRGDRQLAPPAPILPLFAGVGAAFLSYLLWGGVGYPLIGIVGGVIAGSVIVLVLLWRARPPPPIDDEEERR